MENPLYICYSSPLKDFLVAQGEEVLVKGLHMQTKNPFWVFMKSKKLNIELAEWSVGNKDTWCYSLDLKEPGIQSIEYK